MNILVTGATKGIGKSICECLKNEHKIFAVARNSELLKEFENRFVCDLTNNDDLKRLSDYIKTSNIDVLINNAGEYFNTPTDKIEPDKLAHIIKLNLEAPIYLISKVIPYMKSKNFGRIINIGSISGVLGEANASPYSATKAGLIGLSKALALELAPFGITVNTINPGWVDTDMGNLSAEDGGFTKDEITECIPQRRFISPAEIAGMVKYLISTEAKGVTGQSINLCAGLTCGY